MLISKPSPHHLAVILQLVHHDVILLDHSNALWVLEISWLLLLASVVLLCLDDVTPKHLRILYLDLRVIEYVIVVVDILYDLDRASVLTVLLFGLGRSLATLVGAVHLIHRRLLLVLEVVVVAALVTVVAAELVVTSVVAVSRTTVSCSLSLEVMRGPLIFLLVNDFFLVTASLVVIDISDIPV